MERVLLTAEDLLAGSSAVFDVPVPRAVLGADQKWAGAEMTVRLRPLTVGQFLMVMKAATDDASLIPLLMVKESLVEPEASLGQINQMSVGLVSYLVEQIRTISGLSKKKSE